jgi:23S rRNA (pseudouridine1915-N3)-methyltransferase
VQISLVAVGKPGSLLEPAIREYEGRASRYWKLDSTVVRSEAASRNRPVVEVQRAEAERLLGAVARGLDVVALTRAGRAWSSEELAAYLSGLAVTGHPGAAFVIGGAFGLDSGLVRDARHRLALSTMTMPHDLARLVLTEQLYRAGTIVRGEPYHKG